MLNNHLKTEETNWSSFKRNFFCLSLVIKYVSCATCQWPSLSYFALHYVPHVLKRRQAGQFSTHTLPNSYPVMLLEHVQNVSLHCLVEEKHGRPWKWQHLKDSICCSKIYVFQHQWCFHRCAIYPCNRQKAWAQRSWQHFWMLLKYGKWLCNHAFVDEAINSVYWEWFVKVFLSPCGDIHHTNMQCRLRDQRSQAFSCGIWLYFLCTKLFPNSLNLLKMLCIMHCRAWNT